MKKIIYIFGIVFLVSIIILNILFTTNLNNKEQITVHWNKITYIIGAILLAILLFFITKKINDYLNGEKTVNSKKKRKILLIIACVIYLLLNILWVSIIRTKVRSDQLYICNLAQVFYKGDTQDVLSTTTYSGLSLAQYAQCHPQQVTLAFIFSLCFRIFHTDCYTIVLRLLNIVCNCLIVFALYKINQQISKQYQTNQVLLFTLILTFFPLVMLSNFIYGDIPSLALCLFTVYFMMKYTETEKWKYAIIASIFMMIAYMMRMNNMIFIIATVMYLLLTMWKEIKKKQWKENVFRFTLIIVFVIISIVPAKIVNSYWINKLGLEKNKTYPMTSYMLMAMEEGKRGEGWYNGNIANYALKNPEKAKEEYPEKIKERVMYLSKNLGYTSKFYTKKIASMWTENTYSAIFNNISKDYKFVEKLRMPLDFYQKAILLIITICSLIVLIQNRKNLSLEVLFLITIFIGGFAFHILWEAKSRYIIPYIIVLMPVASIAIQKFTRKQIN